ncbi:MAG: thiol:disulfide interchange protein DsbA/DsbL [Burkholderiales bacterium]
MRRWQHRLNAFVIQPLLLLGLVLPAAAVGLEDGKQYRLLNPAVSTETGKNIEVVELFYYGCPHCYDLEPVISKWAKSLPKDVRFRQFPAIFRDTWLPLTKAFYAVDAMGAVEPLHRAIFEAIHKQDLNLTDEKVLFPWVGQQGADQQKFTETYQSFAVQSKATRAKELTRAYGITGVPAVVVNGKYLTSSSMAGGHQSLLNVLDELIKMARKDQAH